MEEEESFVDKCIWIEGKEEPTTVAFGGSEVETSLIGFHMEDMTIRNCGCVAVVSVQLGSFSQGRRTAYYK